MILWHYELNFFDFFEKMSDISCPVYWRLDAVVVYYACYVYVTPFSNHKKTAGRWQHPTAKWIAELLEVFGWATESNTKHASIINRYGVFVNSSSDDFLLFFTTPLLCVMAYTERYRYLRWPSFWAPKNWLPVLNAASAPSEPGQKLACRPLKLQLEG